MGKRQLAMVRKISLGMPEVNERLSHGATCFFLRDKRPLCYYHERDFHDDGSRPALWCPAPLGVQAEMVASEPERFFRPTPSASGVFADWLGVYLDSVGDDRVDWAVVRAVLADAYRCIAPKKLIAELEAR